MVRRSGARAVDSGDSPAWALVALSKVPNRVVKHFSSMYAYGYHFRVDDEIGRSHVSFDSGVACIARQTCRSCRTDSNPIEADLKYVEIIKDIIQVEYGHLKFICLKCSWIRLISKAIGPSVSTSMGSGVLSLMPGRFHLLSHMLCRAT